jgi:hypothetical protein
MNFFLIDLEPILTWKNPLKTLSAKDRKKCMSGNWIWIWKWIYEMNMYRSVHEKNVQKMS